MEDQRNKILQALKQNRPEPVNLPEIPEFATPSEYQQHFSEMLTSVGGRALEVTGPSQIIQDIKSTFPDLSTICSLIDGVPGNYSLDSVKDPHQLKDVELALVPARLAVAENAAVWICEKDIRYRALAFITQHLALVVPKSQLVFNMHQAYQKISEIPDNWGIFISGPSKTADIEQALVLGAHGPRSLTVYLME
ncbi:MAG: LutC/YkgG family protein [Candidatus Cyclobacteriaceae bacterium M3_2C_046]